MILCDGVFQMAGVAEVPEAGEETEIIRKLCYQVIVASFPTFPLFYKIQFLEIFPLKLYLQRHSKLSTTFLLNVYRITQPLEAFSSLHE